MGMMATYALGPRGAEGIEEETAPRVTSTGRAGVQYYSLEPGRAVLCVGHASPCVIARLRAGEFVLEF